MKNIYINVFVALKFSPCKSQVRTNTENKTMNNQIIQDFKVVGISVRTTNEDGQSAEDNEALWRKFWGEEIQRQILNKINDDIYAVYTDYETNFNGPYTLIIG